MVFGISAKAQEKDTCFCHVSFYQWEWDCYYNTGDTIELSDPRSDFYTDTLVREYNNPGSFSLKYPFQESFDSAHFEVTSCYKNINYKVTGFSIIVPGPRNLGFDKYYSGKYFSKSIMSDLNNLRKEKWIMAIGIQIFDHLSQKDILLPFITIIVAELK